MANIKKTTNNKNNDLEHKHVG